MAEDSAFVEYDAASVRDSQDSDNALTLRHIPEERSCQFPRYF